MRLGGRVCASESCCCRDAAPVLKFRSISKPLACIAVSNAESLLLKRRAVRNRIESRVEHEVTRTLTLARRVQRGTDVFLTL